MTDARDIASARLLDFPRERVFAAFSDPARLASWWGPDGFSNRFEAFDFRTGGAWRFVMRGPDGVEVPNDKVFLEVTAPETIVLRHRQEDHTFVMTIRLLDVGAKTRIDWHMRFATVEQAAKVRAVVARANEQNLDRLEAHLVAGS